MIADEKYDPIEVMKSAVPMNRLLMFDRDEIEDINLSIYHGYFIYVINEKTLYKVLNCNLILQE